jgi:ribonuclease P protein component
MADYRFTRQQRLLNAADFQRVFDDTKFKASTRELLILGAANDLGHARIGFIVAKKNIRTAVHRNRIKRVIRENFRIHGGELNSVDLIIMARRGFDKRTNSEISAAFSELLKKIIKQSSARPSSRQL